MNCRRARCYLSPYLDSELDATTTYEISRHLEACPSCARLFAAETELERSIGESLRRPAAGDEELFERALARVLPQGPRTLRGPWLAAAGILLLLLGAVAATVMRASGVARDRDVPELVAMVAHDHARYLRGELAPELRASDPEAVTAYFARRLGAPSPALPSGAGWSIEGARVCLYRSDEVGFVTLRYHGIPVSVVDLSLDADRAGPLARELGADGRCYELSSGRGLVGRTAHGLRAVFGDLEMEKLEEVVAAAR